MIDLAATTPAIEALASALRRRGWRLATAESCTGGRVAAACTSVAGSADWFERGVGTYSNAAKGAMLGVDAALITAHGAVSGEVAQAMAAGAIVRSAADLAISVTGIAGPGGAVPGKPVGTVWLGLMQRGAAPTSERLQLAGDRSSVRAQIVVIALQRLLVQCGADAI